MTNANNKSFEEKWRRGGDEFNIFVPPGQKPRTQRQFNFYYYRRLIKRLLAGRSYHKSIEFGCGRGTFSLYLHLYDRYRVDLFDLSEDGVKLARANFALHNAQGNFFVADSRAVPVPDAQYDLVVSMGLLEHQVDYYQTLREMYRVLKSGGMLITMNIPKKHSIQILNDIYKKVLRVFNKKVEIRQDYFRITDRPEDFQRQAEQAGFRDCRIVHANPFPIFVPIPRWTERSLTWLYRAIMGIRQLYRREPMTTGPHLAQCHFLIGYK